MKYLPFIIGIAGLITAGLLIVYEGPELIFKTFAAAGWGAVIVSISHFPHMAIAGRGWQVLWPPKRRKPLRLFIWALWVREAVNSLLPVARIGGEVAALSILRRYGLPLSSSVGSLVVETTMSVLTTFIFVLISLVLLLHRVPGYGQLLQWAAGLGIAFLVIAAMIALQRYGVFRLASRVLNAMGGGKYHHLIEGGKKLDRAVQVFYGRPWRLFSCAMWSFFGWWIGAVEFWLGLKFLGHPVPFSTAFVLEGMIHATGSMAFFVPASLGVQEATLLFFGQMLGIPGSTCMALALMRRCRDVLIMVPGLILWQVQEGHFHLVTFLKKGSSQLKPKTPSLPPKNS